MGNCQAIDAAALVIQHPDGRLERMFHSVPASEVMRANPGHYVSLIIPLTTEGRGEEGKEEEGGGMMKKRETVRFTHVKLLRPAETLDLGHAYRLVTSQEVMKVLRAKKYGKMMKQRQQQQQHPDEAVVLQQQGKPKMGFSGDHGKGRPGELSDKENNMVPLLLSLKETCRSKNFPTWSFKETSPMVPLLLSLIFDCDFGN